MIAGATAVRGHDLREDLPLGSHRLSYLPPVIRFRGLVGAWRPDGAVYSQTTCSWTTSGDWFQPDVSSVLLDEYEEDWLTVIDIPKYRSDARSLIGPVLATGRERVCLLRLQASHAQMAYSFGVLSRNGRVMSVYGVADYRGFAELLVLWRSGVNRLGRVGIPCLPTRLIMLPETEGKRCVHAIVTNLTQPIGTCRGRSVREVLASYMSDFESSKSLAVGRFSYSSWTSVLAAAVCCEALLKLDFSGILELARHLDTDTVIRFDSVQEGVILVTPELRWVFSRVAVRLIGNLDVPI
jgi:hypothetical protein